ncbi:mechanosensitive ion channel family protein [Rhodococcoides kroppenstedtii]|uniref:mechanosensitive ion channel family protein n=1 Tax=Rhodococcoides kroppenstedtii TaxID=293050 RepID=UPI0020302BA7|nr:hypothetical protein [Rhodococcus kroppenstedtii]
MHGVLRDRRYPEPVSFRGNPIFVSMRAFGRLRRGQLLQGKSRRRSSQRRFYNRRGSMQDALRDGWATVAQFVPKLVLFLLILIIGIIVAKMIGRALSAVLTRVGFDRAVERGGVKKALENSKYDASDVVSKLIYYALVLFVLQLAFGVFGSNPISDLLSRIITFLPSLIVAIIIVVVAAAIAAAVRELIAGTLSGLSYGKTLGTVASVFILGFGIIAALNQIGVATTVTTPVLIAVLATLGGILVVGVGGGLIQPMARRWENYLSRAEDELPKIKDTAQDTPPVTERARRAKHDLEQRN